MIKHVGLFGLGVMGKSLALNAIDQGYTVSVHDINDDVMTDFVKKSEQLIYTKNVESFVKSIPTPRVIVIMVTAGNPVDQVIESMRPYLEAEDIVIDGGNSYYKDTARREALLLKQGVSFLGIGISGGESGARYGASLMPSGNHEAYLKVEAFLSSLAAKTKQGVPCCQYIGKSGSGHYVKMMHNGIEYAEMQLISEIYGILKNVFQQDNEAIAKIFETWQQTPASSYLLEISIDILRYQEAGSYLLDQIEDIAKQKGTGKWTVHDAIDRDISIPSIVAALNERFISLLKEKRQNYESKVNHQSETLALNSSYQDALYWTLMTSRYLIYHQGIDMLRHVSEAEQWDLCLSGITTVWQEGCIIKSSLIEDLSRRLKANEALDILSKEGYLTDISSHLKQYQTIIALSQQALQPISVISASYQYLTSITTAYLPINLIQAQRDYFGGHTYKKLGDDTVYHTQWKQNKE